MLPAMLQKEYVAAPRSDPRERLRRDTGNDRQRHRHLAGNREHTFETLARRGCVVVSPPQRSLPASFRPAVELVYQITPSRAWFGNATR